MKTGTTPPPPGELKITNISVAGGNVTLLFTGAATDSASAFHVLAASNVAGTYALATATITQIAPGNFQAVLPVAGAGQFYKITK